MKLALAVVLAIAADAAVADTYRSETDYFQLELGESVKRVATVAATGEATTLVATFAGKGLHAAITRVAFPNPRAWRRDAEFFLEVEAGLSKSTAGYRLLSRKQHKLGRVPALDLRFRRELDGKAQTVHARFLFFRTFSITLMVGVNDGVPRAAQRTALALTQSFKPYFKE